MNYVTIWSKRGNGMWLIERTHSADYCKCLIGINEIGETVVINGITYGVFGEGHNPNK